MSIEGILIGLFAIGIGLAWAFYGLKLFTILLPIWAFFVGLLAGANWTTELFGDGFFATVTSWAIGVGLGLILAVLSYFVYYFAIAILGGAVGYTIGAGLMAAIGFSDSGLIAIVVGLVVAVVLAAAVIVLAVPVWLVIWLTAIGGAVAAINGVLILLGRIALTDIEHGLGQGLMKDPLIAIVGAVVIAAAGIWYQTRATANMAVAVERSSYRYA